MQRVLGQLRGPGMSTETPKEWPTLTMAVPGHLRLYPAAIGGKIEVTPKVSLRTRDDLSRDTRSRRSP